MVCRFNHRPTFLVTGATSGLGEAIAPSSPNTEGGCWSEHAPASRATARPTEPEPTPDADLKVAVADLSLMQEVRSLAYQIMDSTPRLDGLILNAAEARSDLVLTDGIETNFATNHLAGFLLTHLLLPCSGPRRPREWS